MKDLQRELRCGPRLARAIAKQIGRVLGKKKLIVTRDAFDAYLRGGASPAPGGSR